MPFANLDQWRDRLNDELLNNILPFWRRLRIEGGLIGGLDNANQRIPNTPISLVQVARLVWSYSKAYQVYENSSDLEFANYARSFLLEKMTDRKNGGYYWSVDESGAPIDKKKQTYGQAFVIYALSEHHQATGEEDSLTLARELFQLIEEKCWDSMKGGYLEAFDEEWGQLGDMRLGSEDMNAPKSMNNHLHIIEAYSNLLRVAPTDTVKSSCIRALDVIAERIVNPRTARFQLFFDMDWSHLDHEVSPGHDIEGSWLLYEAAEIIGDHAIEEKTKALALRMAEITLKEGIHSDGSVYDEFKEGHPGSATRCWWPQAEGAVGFFNAYQLSGDKRYLEAAQKTWDFIERRIIDKENGEWFWGVYEDGRNMDREKVGEWKSLYHNSRACFELIARIDLIKAR